ncbi:peptidoglycan-binding protein [Clostridium felsineum]|uniref:peptidoglycan-binding domain-containing protein n=1 Tax=Clostridium felsineum TaxID=36839 RepID=UPI00214D3849|nr:peptidoglycan-binding domain-containing protein [Clostridium felsineum]MCR3760436.1 peptidoglycan-binding protein [Clostridium felsineum]
MKSKKILTLLMSISIVCASTFALSTPASAAINSTSKQTSIKYNLNRIAKDEIANDGFIEKYLNLGGTIKYGDSDAIVKQIQSHLHNAHYLASYQITGVFDDDTVSALQRFQVNHNLKDESPYEVDLLTFSVLENY